MDEQFINAKELSVILSCCVRSVWRYRSEKRLPKAVRVGSSVKWRKSEIDLWLKWDLPGQAEFEARKKREGQ